MDTDVVARDGDARSLTHECFEVHIHMIFVVRNELETGIGGGGGDIVGAV